MWPILRHACPYCHHRSIVKYSPAVFSQSYFCEGCHRASTNSISIMSSEEERAERELAALFSTSMTFSEREKPQHIAQPIPIPHMTSGFMPTPVLSSSSSSPSSTISSLTQVRMSSPPPPSVAVESSQNEKPAPVQFQQYQYYPSMHYTPSYTAYPSTQSSEVMLKRRREEELARLEALAIDRRRATSEPPVRSSSSSSQMVGTGMNMEAEDDGMDVDV